MSFDLAVWDGDRPADNAEAAQVFDKLYAELMESGGLIAPSPRIADYVEGLRAVARHRRRRWADSPWSDGPLLGNASGRLFYLGSTSSSGRDLLREAIDYAVVLAAERRLVCYDPQYGTLR